MAVPLQAQDIYTVEALTSRDLSGTARYVGMGGAMSALGADISTMGVNPAGIGLYRFSDFSLSASATVQAGAKDFAGRGKAAGSFDQAGFVYSQELGGKLTFVNFGFNYRKQSNAKNYAGALGVPTQGLSQSLQMMDLAKDYKTGAWLDLRDPKNEDCDRTTPLTLLGYKTQMIVAEENADGTVEKYVPSEANSYDYRRVQWGGVDAYDFNVAFNWNERVYAGFTFGIYDVNLHSFTDYAEWLYDPTNPTAEEHEYFMQNEDRIYGTGFDFKAGVIVRPIEDSPFRLGFSVATPTFYNLTAESYLYMNSPYKTDTEDFSEADFQTGPYDYKVRTPWRINVSAATTVGSSFAVDAEYELSNYSGAQVRNDHYTYYDYSDRSAKDEALCNEIDRFLKPVHTLKVGAEARAEKFYCRVGYNYVSAPFEKDAYLNQFTGSPSYYNETNTDYINLGDTHRVTCGVGFRGKHFYGDVAYQYQVQQGDLYAFHAPESNSEQNRLQPASLNFERHNVLFTLGCKF